jgi:hypothetical protein
LQDGINVVENVTCTIKRFIHFEIFVDVVIVLVLDDFSAGSAANLFLSKAGRVPALRFSSGKCRWDETISTYQVGKVTTQFDCSKRIIMLYMPWELMLLSFSGCRCKSYSEVLQ